MRISSRPAEPARPAAVGVALRIGVGVVAHRRSCLGHSVAAMVPRCGESIGFGAGGGAAVRQGQRRSSRDHGRARLASARAASSARRSASATKPPSRRGQRGRDAGLGERPRLAGAEARIERRHRATTAFRQIRSARRRGAPRSRRRRTRRASSFRSAVLRAIEVRGAASSVSFSSSSSALGRSAMRTAVADHHDPVGRARAAPRNRRR